MKSNSAAKSIDDYIAAYADDVQKILKKIRSTIQKAAPVAEEKISYGMPSFTFNGYLVYFGAFKKHIGFYPPVKDVKLKKEAAIYAGEKGNLQFPLDEPIPYELISKIVKARVLENKKKLTASKAKS